MIDLYLAGTANGLRASVALEESGLPYRAHKVDLGKGEQRSAEFLKLNPVGQIPVIVDSDGPGGKPLTLAQSGAIILYVAEKSGKFLPKDAARRATAMQWFMSAASDIAGTSNAMFLLDLRAPEKSTANADFFKSRLLNIFATFDARLAGRDFLADELSVADLMIYPNFALRKPLLDAAGGFANLQRWGAVMAARPAVTKGMKAAE
jgi:GSH-dependent disulfide-bond oxidoreductase